ncbi:sulfite exporter TauE/SafE family protein [Streptomyces albipurpureus]|uniref:Probable membrane transporter protein n=1 Tax=Streptomyces albipurpureus TaxID=2897419 RepID=A0ABT0UJI2_9ACTN|nr:sulfite exporter TauE/SafE family protein [Streptomyces sp. CWNU-1]MCM2388604.1 sulfite exporter TauE/SafE family protein [Streptomyces sp. CWNU-1]
MTALEIALVLAAGLAAGTLNTVVGSGSLLTFPVLVALGYPPVVANVSNTVGLTPGSISGALGCRRELAVQKHRLLPLSVAAVLGGLTGALLLLSLSADSFRSVVPLLVLLAALLMALQPWLTRLVSERRNRAPQGPGAPQPTGGGTATAAPTAARTVGRTLPLAVFAVSVYGGYFGAAQGVLLLALLAIVLDDDLRLLNGLKNLLQALVNLIAAALFALTADVAWLPVLLVALGSIPGGLLGAALGRRVPASVLRAVVVTVGMVAGVALLLT